VDAGTRTTRKGENMKLELELTDDEAVEVAAHVLRAPSAVGRRLFMAIALAMPDEPVIGSLAPKVGGAEKIARPARRKPRPKRETWPPPETPGEGPWGHPWSDVVISGDIELPGGYENWRFVRVSSRPVVSWDAGSGAIHGVNADEVFSVTGRPS
jgi:hypothetical protein